MAEAPPVPLSRKAIVNLMNRIFLLMRRNDLPNIQSLLEHLQPGQCTQVLNSSKDNYTLLAYAIEKYKFLIARYLLRIAARQGAEQLCAIWQKTHHPLNAALKVNNLFLIRRITRRLCDINAYSHGPYTPLMLAIYTGVLDHVRFMIRKGADVNLSTERSRTTPLMMSVFNPRICRFLIKMNADLDLQDQNGDTALHKAVDGEYMLSIKFIVEAGANILIKNDEGLTPLMLAVRELNNPMVAFLASLDDYPLLDKMEATQVLNACYVCEGHRTIMHWIRILPYRPSLLARGNAYEPQAILDFSREFRNRGDLELLQTNELKLAFQGILVIERALGRNGKIYLQALLYTALLAKQVYNVDKMKEMIIFIHEVIENLPPRIVCSCSEIFNLIFDSFVQDDDPESFYKNGGFDMFLMTARATEKMWAFIRDELFKTHVIINEGYTNLLTKLLYMVSHILSMNFPRHYLVRFYKTFVNLVRKDPRDENQQSLLHSAIKTYNSKSWITIDLIRVLLQSGADVNAKDYLRRTPMFYAIIFQSRNASREIGELLLKYGAHLDCKTSEGFSLVNYSRWRALALVPRNPLTLQCLAVEAILDNRIDYEGMSHKTLKEFISLHV